ncbi:hypothetical protein BT69DRAFT_1121785 [Atractiella rhizophila]|nr:hypothetical protein BT69DRAFT_1121785 [Atractiella rhizophila]
MGKANWEYEFEDDEELEQAMDEDYERYLKKLTDLRLKQRRSWLLSKAKEEVGLRILPKPNLPINRPAPPLYPLHSPYSRPTSALSSHEHRPTSPLSQYSEDTRSNGPGRRMSNETSLSYGTSSMGPRTPYRGQRAGSSLSFYAESSRHGHASNASDSSHGHTKNGRPSTSLGFHGAGIPRVDRHLSRAGVRSSFSMTLMIRSEKNISAAASFRLSLMMKDRYHQTINSSGRFDFRMKRLERSEQRETRHFRSRVLLLSFRMGTRPQMDRPLGARHGKASQILRARMRNLNEASQRRRREKQRRDNQMSSGYPIPLPLTMKRRSKLEREPGLRSWTTSNSLRRKRGASRLYRARFAVTMTTWDPHL